MITNAKIVDPSYKSRIGQTDIAFKPGINLLAGPNGSGKSSLLNAIKAETDGGDSKIARVIRDPSVQVMYYSGETATIKLAGEPQAAKGDMTSRHQSHGQGLRSYLAALDQMEGDVVVLMDEPETALDFFAVNDLCAMIASKSGTVQFIISTHHPLLFTIKDANIINMDSEPNYAKRVLDRLRKRVAV